MHPQTVKVQEEKGQIIRVELYSLQNNLPVSKDTYHRILHGLLAKGLIQLLGSHPRMRESRQ